MRILIKGAGDLASGVAHRLLSCGYQVIMTEIAEPTTIRRGVAFSTAVSKESCTVEGVTASLAANVEQIEEILSKNEIPVIVDEHAECLKTLRPDVVVDAILAKRNTGTALDDAPLVIGLGPGFTVGEDCHIVIETNRGHDLGRVITQGSAEPDTGIPGDVGGQTVRRIIRASATGRFYPLVTIGERVEKGQVLAWVEGKSRLPEMHDTDTPKGKKVRVREPNRAQLAVYASISGVIRGILPQGAYVTFGMKAGDIDRSGIKEHCFTISDKARGVAGSVLEAVVRREHGCF